MTGPHDSGEGRRVPAATRRLVFRRWDAADTDLALGLWGDPAVTEMIDSRTPLTRDQVLELLASQIAMERAAGVQYWPVFLRQGGAPAGCCGLRPHAPDEPVYEIGFHLRREAWGRGLAMEAATSAIDFGFADMGAAALLAGHHPDNAASRRILIDLGFRHIGDDFYPPTGLRHPSYRLDRGDHLRVGGVKG